MNRRRKYEYELFYLASPYTFIEATAGKAFLLLSFLRNTVRGLFGLEKRDYLAEKTRLNRYLLAEKATLVFLKLGHYVFSPIAYNHPMGRHDLPTDWAFWEPFDKAFLERCTAVIVIKLPGWNVSVGVAAEVEWADKLKIPVYYIEPEDVFAEGFVFDRDKLERK